MLCPASTLAHEKSRQFSVKHIGGMSLKVLIKHGTGLRQWTSILVSQL